MLPLRAPAGVPAAAGPSAAADVPAAASVIPTVGVIVVAAGNGTRLGNPVPKAFVKLGGRPLLAHALDGVFGLAETVQVIVVVPAPRIDEATKIAMTVAGPASGSVTIVQGGATRQLSVAAGLAALDGSVDTVLVHDCARALTPAALFDRVIAAVRRVGAGVIPGLAVVDTIKRTDAGLALETIDRSELTAVQTPQGFPREHLVAAYERAVSEYTDDAALFSAAGRTVHVVEGDPLAFKITTPWDLKRAESLLEPSLVEPVETPTPASAPIRGIRTGIGVDVHAYDAAVPLWLGGLYWPDEVGLAGHSDGDAVAHAICDALLSAAGLGDIGGHFGTADPAFAGAHGDVFLRESLALVSREGFAVQNVAVQVIGKTPRMAARRLDVERYLSGVVGAPVSVSATTTDGLGFTGRGEGLTAVATVLLTV